MCSNFFKRSRKAKIRSLFPESQNFSQTAQSVRICSLSRLVSGSFRWMHCQLTLTTLVRCEHCTVASAAGSSWPILLQAGFYILFPLFFFFGRMRLKKFSEKIDDVRPKMEQIQRRRGSASSCRRKKFSPLPFELIINAAQWAKRKYRAAYLRITDKNERGRRSLVVASQAQIMQKMLQKLMPEIWRSSLIFVLTRVRFELDSNIKIRPPPHSELDQT